MALDAIAARPNPGWPTHTEPAAESSANRVTPDHFVVQDNVEFAGTHIIIDLWDAQGLDDLERMETAFREVIATCGATLLHIHLHHFTPNDGISGVAVLAESHLSVHTWPERAFAAFDVFMCGDARPELAAAVLERHFSPGRVIVNEMRRGIVSDGR